MSACRSCGHAVEGDAVLCDSCRATWQDIERSPARQHPSAKTPIFFIASAVALWLLFDASRAVGRPMDDFGARGFMMIAKFAAALFVSLFAFAMSVRLTPWLRISGIAVLTVCIVVTWRSCS